jgi:hypothetical protein
MLKESYRVQTRCNVTHYWKNPAGVSDEQTTSNMPQDTTVQTDHTYWKLIRWQRLISFSSDIGKSKHIHQYAAWWFLTDQVSELCKTLFFKTRCKWQNTFFFLKSPLSFLNKKLHLQKLTRLITKTKYMTQKTVPRNVSSGLRYKDQNCSFALQKRLTQMSST